MHIHQTIHWIQSIVIPLNLCPFAKREVDSNSLRIEVSSAVDFEDGIQHFIKEIEHLNVNPATGTSLLLFPYFLDDFLTYLDFVDLANETLVQMKYQGVYQLATFHPKYHFHNTAVDDVTNYTNRSPYPMLHLLREEMLDRAIDYYGDTESIPANNILRLQKLELAEVKKLWESVFENS